MSDVQLKELESLNRSVNKLNPNNNAKPLVNSWHNWFDSLSWFDKTMNDKILTEANMRHASIVHAQSAADFGAVYIQSEKAPLGYASGAKTYDKVSPNETGSVATSSKTVDDSAPSASLEPAPEAQKNVATDIKGATKIWQGIVGVTQDGIFGPDTSLATKIYQASKGLTADGIVGPKTWQAAGYSNMPLLKQGSGGSTKSAATPTKTTTPAKVQYASFWDTLPNWAKWIGGVGLASAAAVGIKKTLDKR